MNDIGCRSGDVALDRHPAEGRRSSLVARCTDGRRSTTRSASSLSTVVREGLCAWSADSRRVSSASAPPGGAPPPREVAVSGTLEDYILNDRGDIDGLILGNGNEVKVPPLIGMPAAMALAQQPSAPIQASGYGASNAFGTVVDAMTGSLTVGSQPLPRAGSPGPPSPP